jgi:hypothetical protein
MSTPFAASRFCNKKGRYTFRPFLGILVTIYFAGFGLR